MQPPLLDARDMQALKAQLVNMNPFYTPEWRFSPEDPDPGTVLFIIFARMFQENIKRFNKVPMKNFIAFLNMLNITPQPSRPATVFVTFNLSNGATEPVLIPAGTRVAANASDGGEQIIFETEGNMLITPAAIVDAYSVSVEQDKILKIPEPFWAPEPQEKQPIALFDFAGSENLQEHSLYLGHTYLFDIRETALLEVELKNSVMQYKEPYFCEKLANSDHVEWTYRTEEGWESFDGVSVKGNRLVLEKSRRLPIALHEINGIKDRWIRCRALEGRVDNLDDIEIDGIGLGAKFYDCENRGGITPDMLFNNDIQLAAEGCYPLGKYFALFDTFYFSSREVLSKRGAKISIKFYLRHEENLMQQQPPGEPNWKMIMKKSSFDEPDPPRVSILTASWEYWNGSGWAKLFSRQDYEEIFYHPAGMEKEIEFICPEDMQETSVNDFSGYWVRVRVINIENNYAVNSFYRAPLVENLLLTYAYAEGRIAAEHTLTYNNLEYIDPSSNAGSTTKRPFYSFDCRQPAFYLGFDKPPVKGPISMFFSVKSRKLTADKPPLTDWEYLRIRGGALEWSALKTVDGTHSFTASGGIVFAGSPDFAHASLFGRELYWIRIISRDGKYGGADKDLTLPYINGVYLNSTRVIQQESINNEFFETRPGDIGKEYRLSRAPVLSEEVWVNEARLISEDDRKRLMENTPARVEEIRDLKGNLDKFWVKWTEVDYLLGSGPEDRHYTINRLTGGICFGDGKNGKLPPLKGMQNIKINYKIGGGTRGNVAPRDIVTIQSSIAYINGVFNSEPSGGGCDTEDFAGAVRRGPQILKHRNRAVTVGDFEWLTRQASQNIARVKCLPNYNRQGEREAGCVTVVVLPKDSRAGEVVFPKIKQQVEKYILERAANAVAFPEKIQVILPVYLEISVYVVMVVNDMDVLALAEKEAQEKINNFLDPLAGNYDGKGWEIGYCPHISTFYALFNSINAVNFVEKVSMTVYKIDSGQRTELDANNLPELPHGMVTNGKHRLDVKVP